MKKVVLTLGLVAFLFAGGVTVQTVSASPTKKVVYDDPPKKADKKSDKSCTSYSKSSKCCSHSSAMGKSECKDKEGAKTASVSNTNSEETKKASPDKK